jgi:pimeloyl-ACP methyl ester carboxylesterase
LQKWCRLTKRAVDRWVRGAFPGVFHALSFFRFDGESQPSHLPLTHPVRPNTMNSNKVTYIEVDGYSVAYRQAGQGPPLVLLHGFLCDSRCWRHQLQILSHQFKVVAWDAPGAGLSSDPPDPFTISDWSHFLAKFLNRIGIEQAYILGLSWGGLLAQEFYRLYPERILRLILADTTPGWKGSFPESVCQQRLVRCERDSLLPPEELANLWMPEMFTNSSSQDLREELVSIMSDFHPLGFRLMAKSLADTDMRGLLPKIQSPTLLLWGDDDRRCPISIAAELRDAIPNSELMVIANAGHISNMEQSDVFNDHVQRFCLSA